MGRAKMARWGQGAVNSRGMRQTTGGRGRQMCTSRQRRGRHDFEQAGVWGSCVSAQCGRIAYATPSESKWGGLNLSKSSSSKALDRTVVAVPHSFCPVLCCCGSYLRTSSLRAADCNANTIPPNSGLFELVPSSSLPTRAHLSASSPWNLQHPDPIVPSLHDPSTPKIAPRNPYPPSCPSAHPIVEFRRPIRPFSSQCPRIFTV